MQHGGDGGAVNTEFEYLKNIMFQVKNLTLCLSPFCKWNFSLYEKKKPILFAEWKQYLTGTTNGNSETLVKVISAVLKFSPQQTQVALEKEHQKRSLVRFL